jgi:hypothetical protein
VGEGWQEGEEEAVGSRVVGGERRKRWVRKKMIKGCRCGLSWAVLMVVGLNWANVLVCIIIVTTVIHRTPLVLGNLFGEEEVTTVVWGGSDYCGALPS